MPDVDGGPTIFDVTADVELFKAGTVNRGWVLRPSTSGTGDGWTLNASEFAADPALRPTLEIVYSLPVTQRPFDAWAAARGLAGTNAAPTANPDLDRANNLAEFAYNLNPLVADAAPIAPAGTNGLPAAAYLSNVGSGTLEVRFPRRKGATATGLSYTVQFSSNLLTWANGLAPVVTSVGTDWDVVTVRDAVSGAAGRFARVVLTLQP